MHCTYFKILGCDSLSLYNNMPNGYEYFVLLQYIRIKYKIYGMLSFIPPVWIRIYFKVELTFSGHFSLTIYFMDKAIYLYGKNIISWKFLKDPTYP